MKLLTNKQNGIKLFTNKQITRNTNKTPNR